MLTVTGYIPNVTIESCYEVMSVFKLYSKPVPYYSFSGATRLCKIELNATLAYLEKSRYIYKTHGGYSVCRKVKVHLYDES